MDLKERLAQFPFFAHLKPRELASLASSLPQHHFKVGQKILKQGGPCDTAHLLIEGSVDITTDSREGRQAHIMMHRAPSLFGIIEIWRTVPHLGNVTAREPCTTLALKKADYLRVLHSNHQACVSIIQFLSDQIYQNGIDHRIRIFGSASHVLARNLWNEAVSFGEKFQAGVLLRNPVNKSEIAKSLGISRRQIIREFGLLEKAGLIEVQGGHLFFPSLDRLREKADEAWFERRKTPRSRKTAG